MKIYQITRITPQLWSLIMFCEEIEEKYVHILFLWLLPWPISFLCLLLKRKCTTNLNLKQNNSERVASNVFKYQNASRPFQTSAKGTMGCVCCQAFWHCCHSDGIEDGLRKAYWNKSKCPRSQALVSERGGRAQTSKHAPKEHKRRTRPFVTNVSLPMSLSSAALYCLKTQRFL